MTAARSVQLLPVEFFHRPADEVAPDLLGAIIVSGSGRNLTSGRIVETEAYLGGVDPASHAYRLRRHARNRALFGPPGTWYVYRSYGVHWCMNLVCAMEGQGGAVLIRALEPLEGLALMRRRRGALRPTEYCSGPGKLTEALGVSLRLDGRLMPESRVRVLREPAAKQPELVVTPRIGITKAADWPLRFVVRGSPFASRSRGSEWIGRKARGAAD
jgi:DNA-3-methyladenine glycosylase